MNKHPMNNPAMNKHPMNNPALNDHGTPAGEIKRFVRLPEVLQAVGVAERTLYDLMSRGEFPRPAKIGKMSVWVEDEVAQWQQARLKDRRAGPTHPAPDQTNHIAT